jgi:hypothetical protein
MGCGRSSMLVENPINFQIKKVQMFNIKIIDDVLIY